jgi:DNA-binding NtrC family response regulator
MQRLIAYQWPGNVRELKHVAQRTLIMSGSAKLEIELPDRFDSPCVQ